MRHLVEGPDGVGKTTFARLLALKLGVPLYQDAVTKRLVAEGASPAEIQAGQEPLIAFLDQVARSGHDHVLDRGWITAVVYSRADLKRPPLPKHLSDIAWRAQSLREFEIVYAVGAPIDVALSRVKARGETHHDEAFARRVYEEFVWVYGEFSRFCVPIVHVDGTRGIGVEEDFDE